MAGGGLKEVGFEAMTKKKAEEIQTLIKTINQNATAIGEKEVFKPTTKTTDALLALANKVGDLADYDEFLDHIYFLFWEGTKTDSGVRDLQAIKDANLLRNAHSHDFDHSPGIRGPGLNCYGYGRTMFFVIRS